MNNYRCLNDNDCNVLYAYDVISPESIAILKADEIIVSSETLEQNVLVNQVGATVNYVVYGFVLLVAIIMLLAFLNKLFSK